VHCVVCGWGFAPDPTGEFTALFFSAGAFGERSHFLEGKGKERLCPSTNWGQI